MQSVLNAPASAVQQKTDHRSGKYIAFRPGSEVFAIQVLQVRESVAIQEITAVPQTPHGVKGVINLRGKVIPVADLRLRFGFQELEHSPRTCIIVVQMDGGAGVALPYLHGMANVKRQGQVPVGSPSGARRGRVGSVVVAGDSRARVSRDVSKEIKSNG